MIKINLLGQPTPAARAVAVPTSVARQAVVFVVAVAISMSIVGFMYYYWSRQVTSERAALVREQNRQKELAGVKAQNQLYQRQLAQLQERIDTIQKLQSSRSGPVDMLMGLGDTVNRTKDLYLTTVEPQGNSLDIKGLALTVQSIADFITALNESSKFENVALTEYYQDNQEDRTRFKFELHCTYKLPAPPQTPGGPGQAQPAAPTAGRPAGR